MFPSKNVWFCIFFIIHIICFSVLKPVVKLHPVDTKEIARWTKIKSKTNNARESREHVPIKEKAKIGSDRYLCDLCPKWFPSKSRLRKHMLCHSVRLFCDFCSKSFFVKSRLETHIVNRHKFKTFYYCDYCPKRSGVKFRLENHIKENHRKFTCNVCGLHFSKYRLLLSHFYKHEELLPCPFCDKKVKAKSLQSHKNYYHIYEKNTKREACPICGVMTLAHYLKKHISTHEHICCLKCPSKFKSSEELKA